MNEITEPNWHAEQLAAVFRMLGDQPRIQARIQLRRSCTETRALIRQRARDFRRHIRQLQQLMVQISTTTLAFANNYPTMLDQFLTIKFLLTSFLHETREMAKECDELRRLLMIHTTQQSLILKVAERENWPVFPVSKDNICQQEQ
jgi:hypothetical protein